MGIGQSPSCQESTGEVATLHDEFVRVKDVTDLARDLYKQAMSKIKVTGLNEDGGVGYAFKQIAYAHDE